MAILAAAFFLLDVAVRRIAIDWQGARSGVAGALATSKVGDGTVEAWRKARSKGSARPASRPEPGATADGGDAMRETLERGPGLDVRNAVKDGGGTQDGLRGAARAGEGGPKPSGDAPAQGDEETTSRLLRAKRRATGGDENEPPDSAKGGGRGA